MLPLLAPTTYFVLIVSCIGSFQVFSQVYVMTGGGPLNRTLVLVYYLYDRAFGSFRIGYAVAIPFVLFGDHAHTHSAAAGAPATPHPLRSLTRCPMLTGNQSSPSRSNAVRRRRGPGRIAAQAALAVAVAAVCLPFMWMLLTSVKVPVDIFSGRFWPSRFAWKSHVCVAGCAIWTVLF